MASIKKYQGKGGISWNVRVRKGGKLHSGTFPTKRMAEEFAIKLEHQIVQEHYDLVPHKPIIHTCHELIQLYLERKMPEKDPGTQRRQRQILRWWDSVLQDTPVKNLTPVLIEEYKHVLLSKKGFTPGTVNLYLNTLSPVFTWAASPSLNWLQLNPFVHVPRLKDQPRLPVVSDEQLNMLIYWCDQSRSTPLPIFIRIALGTGGRHREILRLRWSHINLKQRTIRYTNTKNKDDRIVPLPSALVDYLTPLYEELFGGDKWMFNLPDGTWVFPNTRTKKGQHMVTMYGPWAKAREKAGLGWMHIHNLRHLYASLAAEKGGADLGMLSDLLGHRQAYPDVFARFERIRSGLDVNVPIVSSIIEREYNGEKEILVQTRWKPERDPVYSGTLEIPAGGMHVYENVYDAVRREVLEETGLRVTSFYPDIRTKTYAPKDDDCFAFVPFCCQQQLKGGLPRVGFVFLCQVEDAEPIPQHEEVRDIRWMKVSELRKIFEHTPEKIFTLHLGVLEYYLQHGRNHL